MNIGFSTISTIIKLKETDQINNAQISSFYNGVTQFVSTFAKIFLTKAQCLTMWSEIQWSLILSSYIKKMWEFYNQSLKNCWLISILLYYIYLPSIIKMYLQIYKFIKSLFDKNNNVYDQKYITTYTNLVYH